MARRMEIAEVAECSTLTAGFVVRLLAVEGMVLMTRWETQR